MMKTTGFSYGKRQIIIAELHGFNRNEFLMMPGLPLVEAHNLIRSFNSEHSSNATMISPGVADAFLTAHKTPDAMVWWDIRGHLKFPTNAYIIYTNANERFGKWVVPSFGDAAGQVYEVPRKYQGEKNLALVAPCMSARNFHKNRNEVLLKILEDSIIVVPNFPSEAETWARVEPKTMVPHLFSRQDTLKRLLKRHECPYVGPIHREADINSSSRENIVVHADSIPSSRFGVLVEIPENDSWKFAKDELKAAA